MSACECVECVLCVCFVRVVFVCDRCHLGLWNETSLTCFPVEARRREMCVNAEVNL